MNEVLILRRAEAELFAHYQWLDGQTPGRGAEFDADVDEAMRLLARHPAMASRYALTGCRCYRLQRWHFGLFYTIEARRVIVCAALDLRQDPAAILRRLGLH